MSPVSIRCTKFPALPFNLGLTGFFQAFPFVIFGLFAGAVADAFDRKKLLIATVSIQFIPSLLLGVLTVTGNVQAWHVYTLGFLGALVEVFNWPARSALIPAIGAAPIANECSDPQHDYHSNELFTRTGNRRGLD